MAIGWVGLGVLRLGRAGGSGWAGGVRSARPGSGRLPERITRRPGPQERAQARSSEPAGWPRRE